MSLDVKAFKNKNLTTATFTQRKYGNMLYTSIHGGYKM